ncbi:MAG: YkgJ family cysteine cluster protein [Bryobacteraceae bacterium]
MDESTLLRILDDATAEAQRRAQGGILCAPGCGECCHRMFAIAAVDAERLHRGLAQLEQSDPAQAAAIRERARKAWDRVKMDFPGDAATGLLTGNEEWRDWFWARTQGVPCPVQDPETQACSMHEHRTAACRLYGPLLRIGGDWSGPCPKCYPGLSRAEIEPLAVTVEGDPGDWGEPAAETVIAAAIALR